MKRIALLSNVNIDPLKRKLSSIGNEVWTPAGYGEVLGALIDQGSGLRDFEPSQIFLLIDLSDLLANCDGASEVDHTIDRWYDRLGSCALGGAEVFVSTCTCRYEPFCGDWKTSPAAFAETLWEAKLNELIKAHDNVFRFELANIVKAIGANAFFTDKLWYLGRIPYTTVAADAMVEAIVAASAGEKKVLLVDLDNTIWGGIVGEAGAQGIELSDEQNGLIYKDVQREIRRIKNAGIVICVVSKNNFNDGIAPFRENGQMVLKEDDITSFKMNWERKDRNICELSQELNVGLDSMVFLDDNPTERQLVRAMLPEVVVLDFPDDVSEAPALLRSTFKRYFQRRALTAEDRAKTEQYEAMAKRAELERASTSFEDYLKSLDIQAHRVNPPDRKARIAQLIGKTNQFNLATTRYTAAEVEGMIESSEYEVYAFDIVDSFANNGLTALAIVDLRGKDPFIDTFILSCRIMGKGIEDFVVDYVERELSDRGYQSLGGMYRPTAKNGAVEKLYDRLGYRRVEEGEEGVVRYSIDLASRPERIHYVREV